MPAPSRFIASFIASWPSRTTSRALTGATTGATPDQARSPGATPPWQTSGAAVRRALHRPIPQIGAVGASRRTIATALLARACLAGCANPWQRFTAGDDVNQVTAALGKPKEVYPLPNGEQRLLWPTRPFGETTTAAVVDASGKLLSIQQVLTNDSFYQAEVGKWTKQDVQSHFGLPEETSYFPLMKREVWSYRYMDANVWYMLYHFYFDDTGVLRLTQKTQDPLHDPDNRNGL